MFHELYHHEEDDLLSTYLNVLKSQEIVSMIHTVHIYDESESVKNSKIRNKSKQSNPKKENKKTIGNRVLKAIYDFTECSKRYHKIKICSIKEFR